MSASMKLLQNGKLPKCFIEFKGKEMPKPGSRQITVDIYRTEQRMIHDWIESAITPVQAIDARDIEAVEKVRQRTSQMMDLFKKFQARLPVWLYYVGNIMGYSYLYDYKIFLDHLRALENHSYKYSVDELQTVEEKLRRNLNVMHLYSV